MKEVWHKCEMEALSIKLEQLDTKTEQTLDVIWELPECKRIEILTFWWHW
jgi:hypothetical protein